MSTSQVPTVEAVAENEQPLTPLQINEAATQAARDEVELQTERLQTLKAALPLQQELLGTLLNERTELRGQSADYIFTLNDLKPKKGNLVGHIDRLNGQLTNALKPKSSSRSRIPDIRAMIATKEAELEAHGKTIAEVEARQAAHKADIDAKAASTDAQSLLVKNMESDIKEAEYKVTFGTFTIRALQTEHEELLKQPCEGQQPQGQEELEKMTVSITRYNGCTEDDLATTLEPSKQPYMVDTFPGRVIKVTSSDDQTSTPDIIEPTEVGQFGFFGTINGTIVDTGESDYAVGEYLITVEGTRSGLAVCNGSVIFITVDPVTGKVQRIKSYSPPDVLVIHMQNRIKVGPMPEQDD